MLQSKVIRDIHGFRRRHRYIASAKGPCPTIVSVMSTVQEVQNALLQMSPEERNSVKAFLLHLARTNDPEHKAEMTRRLENMEKGGGVPQAKLEQLHADLCDKGL